MKKILLALSAVALLFATSCKKENVNPAIDVPEGSFLATIDNGANPQNAPVVKDGMGTMTTIDANRYVIWENGDKISINGSTYTTSSTPGSSAVFSGGNATGTTFHAFFPATIAGTDNAGTLPATQTIELDGNNNITVRNLPMYATSTNNQLTFHNICAALKVNIPIACDSIVVSSDDNICGAFNLNGYTAELDENSANLGKSVKVVKGTGSFAKDEVAYVAIPAGTYTNFTVKFYSGTSIVGQKTLASLPVQVNKVYNLNIPMELCFTYVKKVASYCTIKVEKKGSPNITLDTCTYNASTHTYTNWASYSAGNEIKLYNVGDKVYFRAGENGNSTFYEDNNNFCWFSSSDNVEVSGNIMCLLSQTPSTTFPTGSTNTFMGLFRNMRKLTSAENLVLPATTLVQGCYYDLFLNCTALVKVPELPATTLAAKCYHSMLKGCTGLTTAPVLPATTLADTCYRQMFNGCKNLEEVTMKATNVSASMCLDQWLKNAGTSSGTHILYVDNSMTTNSDVVNSKGNFTIQSYNPPSSVRRK